MSHRPRRQPRPDFLQHEEHLEIQDEQEAHALRLVCDKSGQRFVFSYSAGQEAQAINDIVQTVRDERSNLDWFDAAVLCHKMGQDMGEQLRRLVRAA